MRGIVELEVLKAIEMKLPPNIPVRSFFDLIVGTRFVHGASFLSLTKFENTPLSLYGWARLFSVFPVDLLF